MTDRKRAELVAELDALAERIEEHAQTLQGISDRIAELEERHGTAAG